MVNEAVGDRNHLVRPPFKEADFGRGADGEFGLSAGLREAEGHELRSEGGIYFLKVGERFLPNGGIQKILIQFTARAATEMGTARGLIHKLEREYHAAR